MRGHSHVRVLRNPTVPRQRVSCMHGIVRAQPCEHIYHKPAWSIPYYTLRPKVFCKLAAITRGTKWAYTLMLAKGKGGVSAPTLCPYHDHTLTIPLPIPGSTRFYEVRWASQLVRLTGRQGYHVRPPLPLVLAQHHARSLCHLSQTLLYPRGEH